VDDRFGFAVAGVDLVLNFFAGDVNCRVQIIFSRFGKKIRAAHGEPHGAGELPFRHAGMVVFECDARVHDAMVKMFEFVESRENMLFDGVGERDVVRGQNQFHKKKMPLPRAKIQFYFGKICWSGIHAKIGLLSSNFELCLGAMAFGLQLSQRLTQSLVLAPQLQQSLALLQAPTLELKALVEQELQQNPVLEEVIGQEIELRDKVADDSDAPTTPDLAEPPEDVKFDADTEKNSNDQTDEFQVEFEKLVQLDQEWRDHFSATNMPNRASAEDEEKRQFMFDSLTVETSLAQFLMEQIRETNLSEDERGIAELLIGNIDDFGYLKATVEEMAAANNLPAEKISEVLKVLQTFEPVGVGARDLRECLLLQLQRAEKTETLEYRIIHDFMDALGKRRIPEIARGTNQDVEAVQEALAKISRLEPRPGRAFLPDAQQYVTAEVFVQKSGDDYIVTTNDEQIPHLRISNVYKDLMSQGENSAEVKNYIREKIRAGKFLIKSLHQRQTTILNIGREIVKRQRDFMEKGVAHLRPMTMAQVAEVVGVHETTVSRGVSGKYIETPQGIFEMKFFFTAGLQTTSGNDVSNTSVKDMIAEIFKIENTAKPLSDQEVVKMLADKGITIARRTVAKYRDELGILPSNLRKVY
jgi:RNA polymerase sigma-54 factor